MTGADLQARAGAAIAGMERLARRLRAGADELTALFPLAPERFDPDALDPVTGLRLDGFRVRFCDLEDMMGRVVLPLAVALEAGPERLDERPVEECVQALHDWGLIDAEAWHAAREVRNRLAHPEPGAGAQRARALNEAWHDTGMLLQAAERLAAWMRARLPEAPGGR